jgi:hypothetical protein
MQPANQKNGNDQRFGNTIQKGCIIRSLFQAIIAPDFVLFFKLVGVTAQARDDRAIAANGKRSGAPSRAIVERVLDLFIRIGSTGPSLDAGVAKRFGSNCWIVNAASGHK